MAGIWDVCAVYNKKEKLPKKYCLIFLKVKLIKKKKNI